MSPAEQAVTISPYLVVTARYRVLPRVEARAKTNFVGAAQSCMLPSFLDLRVARTKSPRSRQYLTRRPTIFAQGVLNSATNLQLYRAMLFKFFAAGRPAQLTRASRRFMRLHRASVHSTQVSSLGAARLAFKRRGSSGHLYARQMGLVSSVQQTRRRAFASRRTLFPVSWAAPRP